MVKRLIMCLLISLLPGCATLFSGTSQTLNVRVVDAANNDLLNGCVCTLIDGSGGSYAITSNPATINVSKSSGSIVINCKKEGYRQLNMAVGDSFNALTIVNVLFWPGFIIDGVSGAYRKYPSHYLINMERMK